MALPTNYTHLLRAGVDNQRAGYRNQAFLAPASWFTTIQEPAANSTDAAAVTVATDHVFATGKGFLEIYVLPQSIEAPAESGGEEGALYMNWKPKFFIPGDTAAQQQLIERQLLNDDLVMLVRDASCPNGGIRMFGCNCTPLVINKAGFESGTKNNGKKGWTIEASTLCRYFYTGLIVKAA